MVYVMKTMRFLFSSIAFLLVLFSIYFHEYFIGHGKSELIDEKIGKQHLGGSCIVVAGFVEIKEDIGINDDTEMVSV